MKSSIKCFTLGLLPIVFPVTVIGFLATAPSQAMSIEIASPSVEVVSPPDGTIYNIYPLTSKNITGVGKASVTLKAIYKAGEKQDIPITELLSMFLDSNVRSNVDVINITKTENVSRIVNFWPLISKLGIGIHTAKMSYKLTAFNFEVDSKNPNLFHSISSGPSGPIPVTLLDLPDVNKFEIISEKSTEGAPGPLPALGVAAAYGYSRKLRKRIKSCANCVSSNYTMFADA